VLVICIVSVPVKEHVAVYVLLCELRYICWKTVTEQCNSQWKITTYERHESHYTLQSTELQLLSLMNHMQYKHYAILVCGSYETEME